MGTANPRRGPSERKRGARNGKGGVWQEPYPTIAINLRTARLRARFTLLDVAVALDCAESTVGDWERATQRIPLVKLIAVADRLGTSVDALVRREQ